jgi:hypothetical protein
MTKDFTLGIGPTPIISTKDTMPSTILIHVLDTTGTMRQIDTIELLKVFRGLAPDLMDKLWKQIQD